MRARRGGGGGHVVVIIIYGGMRQKRGTVVVTCGGTGDVGESKMKVRHHFRRCVWREVGEDMMRARRRPCCCCCMWRDEARVRRHCRMQRDGQGG